MPRWSRGAAQHTNGTQLQMGVNRPGAKPAVERLLPPLPGPLL